MSHLFKSKAAECEWKSNVVVASQVERHWIRHLTNEVGSQTQAESLRRKLGSSVESSGVLLQLRAHETLQPQVRLTAVKICKAMNS